MMTSAVYFPTMHPDEPLMKRALLTWDYVEVFAGEDAECQHLHGEFREAWELVCRPKRITDTERAQLRQCIEALVVNGIPKDLEFDLVEFERLPILYPRMASRGFADEAELLFELNLARKDNEGFICTSMKTLHLLSALLAEVTAGSTKEQITDWQDTYLAYCRLIARARGNQNDFKLQEGDQLMSVALETVNLKDVDLGTLIKFRRREQKDPALGVLRRKFADDLRSFISTISTQKQLTASDWEEIQRNYRLRVSGDIKDLCSELDCETSAFMLSKAIVAPIVTGIGTFLCLLVSHSSPAAAASASIATATATEFALSVTEVLSSGRDALSKQAKILKSHPLAYFYELSRST